MKNSALRMMVESNIDLNNFEIIHEQTNKSEPKFLKIRGPYITMNEKNANGRRYPDKLMIPVVEKYIQSMIETNRALGELNHPEHLEIDPMKTCHRMTGLTRENNVFMGESIVTFSQPEHGIIGTPCGDILASNIQHGFTPGMSTRGAGSIENGIVTEYHMVTVDCVTDPSGPGCFVNGIMESRNFMIDVHGELVEMAYHNMDQKLATMPNTFVKAENTDYFMNTMQEFMKGLSNIR